MNLFRGRRARLGSILAMSAMLLVIAQPVDASTLKFGAKVAAGIDPSGSPELCDHELNGGSGTYSCTWILNQSYNGGSVTSPATGHIVKIKLISWTPGTLKVFVARKNGSGQFEVVAAGPKITYHDGCPSSCSVQSYSISPLAVHSGDYLAVKGANMGPLRCDSGGTRTYLFTPPLVVGGGFHSPSGSSGCFLMVQAVLG